jgi:hypothetical protein
MLTLQTLKEHEIRLKEAFDWILWSKGDASLGCTAKKQILRDMDMGVSQ